MKWEIAIFIGIFCLIFVLGEIEMLSEQQPFFQDLDQKNLPGFIQPDSFEIRDGFSKNYTSKDQRLVIKDSLDRDVINLQLISSLNNQVTAGNDVLVAEFLLTDFLTGRTDLFDEVNMFDLKNNNESISKQIRYKYGIDFLEENCFDVDRNPIQCFNVTETNWTEFNDLSELPSKNVKIGLFTNTIFGESVEWIPTIGFFNITEWATFDVTVGTVLEFDTATGGDNSMVKINDTHYLVTYTGADNDGFAAVLRVHNNGTIVNISQFEYNTDNGQFNSLVKINDTHYINAYKGASSTGMVTVLQVDFSDFSISQPGSPLTFEPTNNLWNSMVKINDTHYLNTYAGVSNAGTTTLLRVHGNNTIDELSSLVFDSSSGLGNSLVKINDTHYLNTYAGISTDGAATVLRVHNNNTIDQLGLVEFDTTNNADNSLVKINDTHYLNVYSGQDSDGTATVLRVDFSDFSITNISQFVFDIDRGSDNSLVKINDTHYLNTYAGTGFDGFTVVLQVDFSDFSVTNVSTSFEFDTSFGLDNSLVKKNDTHYVNAWRGGAGATSFAAVFTVEGIAPEDQFPQIFVQSPLNETSSDTSIDYNISVSEALDVAFYSLDEAANATMEQHNSTFYVNLTAQHPDLSIGFHNITFWVNDTDGNGNETTIFFTISAADTTPPIVNLINPIDIQNFSTGTITFSIVATDNINLTNVTLYTNITGTWEANETNSTPFNNSQTNFTITINTDGKYLWNARAGDNSSNFNFSAANRTFTIDTTNPLITYAPPTEANNTNFSRNWIQVNTSYTEIHPDSITFVLFNSTGEVNRTTYPTPNNATNITINFTGLANSIYQYNVTVNDTFGNTNTTETRYITLDTVNPTVTLVNPINNSNFTTTQIVNFSAVCEDELSGVDYCNLYGNWSSAGWHQNQTNSSPVNGSQTNFSVTIEEGKFVWSYFANDTAGNEVFGVNRTIIIDLTAPTIVVQSPTNTSFTDTTIDYNISVSEPLHTAFYSLDEAANATMEQHNLTFYVNLTAQHPALTIGFHNITFWVNDTLGNSNETTIFFTVSPGDITPPIVNLNVPVDVFNSSSATITFSINATDNINLFNVTLFTNITGTWEPNETNSTPVNNSLTNFTITINTDGKYLWNALAYDNSSNFAFNDTNRTFTIDTTNPLINYIAPTEPNNTGRARDWIFVNVSVTEANEQNITFVLFNSTGEVNSTTYTTSIRRINFTGLPDATYQYNVTVVDIVSNTNSTETRYLTLDNVNPLIAYIAPTEVNNSNQSRNWVFVNVSVTETNEQNITFVLFNSTGEVNSTIYTTGIRRINFTGLADSVYQYNVTVVDIASNTNTTETRYITLDTTNPLIEYVAPTEVNNSNRSQNWVFVNVSVIEVNEENITFVLFNSTGQVNSTTYTTPIRSINFTGLANSIYQYNVTVIDITSKSNSTETRYITLDTTNPLIAYGGLTEANNTNFSRNWVAFNVTVTETNEQNITFVLFNSTGQVNSTTYTTAIRRINFTGLADSLYQYNVTVVDIASNTNSTETRYIRLDTTPPVFTDFANQTQTANISLSFDFNATDAGVGLDVFFIDDTVNFTINGSTGVITNITNLVVLNYVLNVSVNDTVGNTASIIWGLNVTLTPFVPPPVRLANVTRIFPNIPLSVPHIKLGKNLVFP